MISLGGAKFFQTRIYGILYLLISFTIIPYFFLTLLIQISNIDSVLRQAARLIEVHEGTQGVVVGTTGIASLVTSLIEVDQKHLLDHITIGNKGKFLLDRSFEVKPEFKMSAKLGHVRHFSLMISGTEVKGMIVFSDKLLVINLLVAFILMLMTILMTSFLKWFQNNRVALAVAKSQSELAKQVKHDILSPLSALNMMTNLLQNVPEHHRVLLRKSVNRINDIANQLSSVGKIHFDRSHRKNEVSQTLNLRVELLSPLIDDLISEKRVQYRDKQNVEIEADLNRGYGLFAKINPTEFKRVLSNLTNNSIEAFPEEKGRFTITIERSGASAVIIAKDNGRGIPADILKKLGGPGITFGKEGHSSGSGSGLGVYHAKKTMEYFHGELQINSTEGEGTTVTILLPLVDSPPWFLEKLMLQENSYIVSLDDDVSVHSVYAQRFQELNMDRYHIKHLTFTSGTEFKRWVHMHSGEKVLYLCDYEFLGQPQNGLDLIEELCMGKSVILVTSRFEEPAIRDRCDRLGVRMVPKSMTPYMPMEIVRAKVKYDCVLIDDDQELVHVVWQSVASAQGLNVATYATPEEFFSKADSMDLSTSIYVDLSLKDGRNGLEVAQKLHELGFSDINLATGYESATIDAPVFIRKIVGKDFPFFERR